MTHNLVVGTSEPQDFQLTDDGENLVGTGFDVAIAFAEDASVDADDVTVDWLSQADGTVRMTDTEDLPVGSHKFRWTLTDGGGKVGFIPNLDAAPNILRVVKV
jgi:hypothetical protein